MIHVFIINARRMPFQAPSANVTATRVKAYVSKVSNIYEEKLLTTWCVPVCACQCVPVRACLPVRACVCVPVRACAKLGSDCGSGAALFHIHTDGRRNDHLQILDHRPTFLFFMQNARRPLHGDPLISSRRSHAGIYQRENKVVSRVLGGDPAARAHRVWAIRHSYISEG